MQFLLWIVDGIFLDVLTRPLSGGDGDRGLSIFAGLLMVVGLIGTIAAMIVLYWP